MPALKKFRSSSLFPTLKEAQEFVEANKVNTCLCPCCGQSAIQFRKPMIGSAVADLVRLVGIYEKTRDVVHINKFTKQRSNFYTLFYWGLIERASNLKVEGKKSAGFWRPTPKAIEFVNGKIYLNKYAETYNNKLVKLTGDLIGVNDALGKKFDFRELKREVNI
jgi:hypothetical protein